MIRGAKWGAFALFVALFFTGQGFAEAVQSRIFYVAPWGNDRDFGTKARPFRTLAKGVSVLRPGSTLYIMEGIYEESLFNNIPGGRSWDEPVTVAAYPGHRVIVRPKPGAYRVLHLQGLDKQYIVIDGLVLDAVHVQYDAVKITYGGSDPANVAHNIRIQNSEIMNAPLQGILADRDNQFINLKVHDNGPRRGNKDHGFYLTGDNNLIDGCEVYNHSGGYGISIYNGAGRANRNIIRRSRIHDNARGGVILASGKGHLMYNNLLWSNGVGVQVDYGAEGAGIYHNTMYRNGEYGGIYVGAGASGTVIANNILYRNVAGLTNRGRDTIARWNLIDIDPKFRDSEAGDFRLVPGSPGIGAAAAIAVVTDDIVGVERGRNGSVTVGAFEFVDD